MKEVSNFKIMKAIVKYGIIIFASMLVMHCFALYLGYDAAIVHIIMVMFALCLGLYLSRMFGLCWVHRMTVLYVCYVLMCIALKPYGVFGDHIQEHRLFTGIAGVLLIILVIWRTRKANC